MRIQTKFFGEVEVIQEQLWNLPKGMPGFEKEKNFVLFPIEGNHLFEVFQSTKTKDVAFIVANPYLLVNEYSFEIDETTLELLSIKKEEDVMVLSVLTLREPFEESTINLQAPLIFNSKLKIAKQMILNDPIYSLRHPIGIKEDSKERAD